MGTVWAATDPILTFRKLPIFEWNTIFSMDHVGAPATFADRQDAALRLSKVLKKYQGLNPLVLAIPRGAVPMARTIASEIGGQLDVILVRKLRAPGQPEMALGAIDENGWICLSEFTDIGGVSTEYLEAEKKLQLKTLRERRLRYCAARSALSPEGRVVIVVDDGLATGSTMVAALHCLRACKPARLVCAVPVASRSAIDRISSMVDELICLASPSNFHAVGQFYENFPQIDDEEVVAALNV